MDAARIDATTLRAYRETDYRVHADPPFTLRIDVTCSALAVEHARRSARCSAFVTACNPLGRPLDVDANAGLHVALVRVLQARGLDFVEGIGCHPSNGWPGERSCLVFGLSREAAEALGAAFRQNAVVWSGTDALPRLLLLR